MATATIRVRSQVGLLAVLFVTMYVQAPAGWSTRYVDAQLPINCGYFHLVCSAAHPSYVYYTRSRASRPILTGRRSTSPVGFYHTRVPSLKWSKHGYTSLLIPGQDPPPLDITMWMDIAVNPGPEELNKSDNKKSSNDLHDNMVNHGTTTGQYILGPLIHHQTTSMHHSNTLDCLGAANVVGNTQQRLNLESSLIRYSRNGLINL